MKLLIVLSMCAVASAAIVSTSSSALQKCQSQCREVYRILNGDGTTLGNEKSFDVSGCFKSCQTSASPQGQNECADCQNACKAASQHMPTSQQSRYLSMCFAQRCGRFCGKQTTRKVLPRTSTNPPKPRVCSLCQETCSQRVEKFSRSTKNNTRVSEFKKRCMDDCAKTSEGMKSLEECCPEGKLCPCQIWFDGCNDNVMVNGKWISKTKMMCSQKSQPYCKQWKTTSLGMTLKEGDSCNMTMTNIRKQQCPSKTCLKSLSSAHCMQGLICRPDRIFDYRPQLRTTRPQPSPRKLFGQSNGGSMKMTCKKEFVVNGDRTTRRSHSF